jgi:hypothetical protein
MDKIKPAHYKTTTQFDVIDFCKAYDLNFNLGNIVKYVARAGKKDSRLQDLQKILEYVQREIQHEENLKRLLFDARDYFTPLGEHLEAQKKMENLQKEVYLDLDKIMLFIKDYRTGEGGITDSFLRNELEMFVTEVKKSQL